MAVCVSIAPMYREITAEATWFAYLAISVFRRQPTFSDNNYVWICAVDQVLLDTDLQFIFSKRSDVFLLVWFLRLGGNGDEMASGAPGDEDTDPKVEFTVSVSVMVDMKRGGGGGGGGAILCIPQAAQCQLASELPRSSYVTVQICWQPAWNHCWHVSHVTPLSTQSQPILQTDTTHTVVVTSPGLRQYRSY